MSYTKGPLRIHGPSPGIGPYDDGGDYAIIDEDNLVIGEAIHRVNENAYRDAEANARLWASAPDLLAERDALRDALKKLMTATAALLHALQIEGIINVENEDFPQYVPEAMKQARAALGTAEEAE